MFRSSIAKIRLQLAVVNQFLILLLSLIIMGTVGINGKISYSGQDSVCVLYTTVDNKVPIYSNGYCLFPVVGAALTFIASCVFLGYFILLLRREEIFAPHYISLSYAITSIVMTLFAFAICGEIGIGLKQGCTSLVKGWTLDQCREIKNFESLYTAQVCAGIMGGAWMAAVLLEYFQFKARPTNAVQPSLPHNDKSSPEGTYGLTPPCCDLSNAVLELMVPILNQLAESQGLVITDACRLMLRPEAFRLEKSSCLVPAAGYTVLLVPLMNVQTTIHIMSEGRVVKTESWGPEKLLLLNDLGIQMGNRGNARFIFLMYHNDTVQRRREIRPRKY